MANTSKIRGFIPVKHVSGAPYTGQANIYAVAASDATAIFIGDPVKITSDGNAQGIQIVTKAGAGVAILGVCVGVINPKFDPVAGSMSNGSVLLDTPQYRAASTAQYILVADSPDLLFEVEACTGANTAYAFAVADIGLNADAQYGVAGSTTTGTSACTLDMATKAITATLQFKIMGVVQRPDNEITGNNTKVLVKFNNAQLSSGTGTLGIA